jgi:cobalt-zinc-cadmium efflux system protein
MSHINHHHRHHHHRDSKEKKVVLSIFLNFAITAIETVGGLLSGSLALLSDALHNLSDAFALIASLIAIKLTKKVNTEKRTFGYKRAEVLVALLNSCILLIVAFFLFKEAVIRFINPGEINAKLMVGVALFGFFANTFSVLILRSEAHKNINIKSAYLHLFSDMLSSIAVIIGGLCIYFFKIYWIDPILTVLIGLYVFKEGYQIVIQALNILMHKVPKGIKISSIKKDIEKVEGVKNIHHVHVWSITESDIFFEGHIDVDRDMKISESCVIKAKIEKMLKEKYSIGHITLQFESYVCKDISLIR